jgi:ABC-type antimicrobial peptide transport system permease subunit
MRSLTRGTFSAARKTIKAHRSRSYMTMLGIVIGIASVVTITSIGEGIKHQVSSQINHTGDNVITIRPGADQNFKSRLGSLVAPRAIGSLSDKDISSVQHTAGVHASAPLTLVAGTVKTNNGVYTSGPVVGAGNDLPQLLNQAIGFGVFFIDDDAGQNVAVLGEHAAIKMFDTEVPLGQTFTFHGQEFMVRGIFNEFPAAPFSADVSFNDAVFIPYSTAKVLTNGNIQPYEILAKTTAPKAVDSTASALSKALLKNHGYTQDFSVLKASDNLAQTSSVLGLLTQLVVGAAAISLFVGGIGIMNITLVSVTERLHEIGIRKAVGATNRQILNEFIAEAVVLSVSGAIIGIVVSLIINLLLRIFTDIAPVVQWQALVIATAVSMLIGILFGSIPALQAARKDPISALRGE